jgi:hypothetical protein
MVALSVDGGMCRRPGPNLRVRLPDCGTSSEGRVSPGKTSDAIVRDGRSELYVVRWCDVRNWGQYKGKSAQQDLERNTARVVFDMRSIGKSFWCSLLFVCESFGRKSFGQGSLVTETPPPHRVNLRLHPRQTPSSQQQQQRSFKLTGHP